MRNRTIKTLPVLVGRNAEQTELSHALRSDRPEDEFTIDKKYDRQLRNKRDTFRRVTGTRKALFLTLVTTNGVRANHLKLELVQNELTAEALFDA
jgi:hypothetical protein